MSKVFKSHELYVISTTPVICKREPVPEAPKASEKDAAATAAAMAIEEAARAVRLREEAERALAEAKEEAERLLREAGKQCADLRDKARDEGYQEGLSQGERQAMEQAQDAFRKAAAHIEAQLRAAEELRVKLLEEAEPQVLELVLRVSEKILNEKLDESDFAFREMVSSAISKLKTGRRITVRVCPADYVRFFKNGTAGIAGSEAGVEIEVEPDGSLSSYDCVVETDGGMTDAGFSGRLARVREEFGLE